MGSAENPSGVKCPYCSGNLEKKPGRKKKCSHCGQYIFIRAGKMKTETEKDFIDYASRLEWLGVTVAKLEKEQKKLSKKLGSRASANDTVWSILNSAVSPGAFHENSIVYQEMARIMSLENRGFSHLIAESQKQQILEAKARGKELKGSGVSSMIVVESYGKMVESYGPDGAHGVCDRCLGLVGKEFQIDEPIENIPLPAEVCEKESGCRCSFEIKMLERSETEEEGLWAALKNLLK